MQRPGIDLFRALPKVDLHRHLEGSLRLDTLSTLGAERGLPALSDHDALQAQVLHQPDDPRDSAFFLSRFKSIRECFLDREAIRELTQAVIYDAADDHIRYLELRMTPAALAAKGGFTFEEVTGWVIDAANDAARSRSVQVGFLLSFNRHEPVEIAKEVLEIALARQDSGVVGLDLAGDERAFPANSFEPVLVKAREAGLGLSIHAGEWGGASEIAFALDVLGATRIGHGVNILQDEHLVEKARKAGVCFEVSLTSNERTGAVTTIRSHPLPEMLQAGLQVALTTDDPGIFSTTLSQEFVLAVDQLGLSFETLKGMMLTAVQSSFQDRKTRALMEAELIQAYWGEGAEM